jgi:hypothetical protein
MSDDLKKDLQLAASNNPAANGNLRISADELSPDSKKEVALKLKQAAGPKVVRTSHPTVKASAQPKEVAELPTQIPQVQTTASAPTESESPAPSLPATARPAPVPLPASPGAATGPGAGGTVGQDAGSGIGAVLGGIFGVVIRGGGADVDHCDPRTDGRRPQGGRVPPVYIPNPGRPMPGGVGGTRFPNTHFPILPMRPRGR